MGWQVVRQKACRWWVLALIYGIAYPWTGLLFSKDPEVLLLFFGIYWMAILTQPVNAVAFALDGMFKGWAGARCCGTHLLISTFLRSSCR